MIMTKKSAILFGILFEVKLTFEMLTVRGQQHSFSTHERMFLRKGHDRLIFQIGIPILVRRHFYIFLSANVGMFSLLYRL